MKILTLDSPFDWTDSVPEVKLHAPLRKITKGQINLINCQAPAACSGLCLVNKFVSHYLTPQPELDNSRAIK